MAKTKPGLNISQLTDYQKKLLIEYYRRNRHKFISSEGSVDVRILKGLFEEQYRFIFSPHELASACCTRRAGKSHACAVGLLHSAVSKPLSQSLYIGLTRLSAKNIMQPTIEKLLKAYSIPYEYFKAELRFVLDNGSHIVLTGAGDSSRDIQKLLGVAYDLVVIDEAQSFPEHLKELIYDVLLITIAERKGKIRVIGTPGIIASGFFYDIATGVETSRHWDTHHWSWENNKAVSSLIEEQIERMVEANPHVVDTPAYKRNYLGEWVADADSLVYKYSPSRNDCSLNSGLETQVSAFDYYVLGVDLGFKDATAFTVVGWHHKSPKVYVVESFKRSGFIPSQIARVIQSFHDKYEQKIIKTVVDEGGLGKSIAEEWRQRYLLSVTPAKKTEKRLFIDEINGMFVDGTIQILPGNEELIEELKTLVWLDSDRKHEHPACDNHLTDSLLYSVRECKQYLYQPEPLKPDPIKEHERNLLSFHERAIEQRMGLAEDQWI